MGYISKKVAAYGQFVLVFYKSILAPGCLGLKAYFVLLKALSPDPQCGRPGYLNFFQLPNIVSNSGPVNKIGYIYMYTKGYIYKVFF